MAAVSPHLAFPFRYAGGRFAAVEQGTVEHHEQRGEVALRTRPGMLEADREFGLRSLVGTLGPVAPEVQAALDRYVEDGAFVAEEDAESIRSRLRDVAVSLATNPEGA